MSCNSLFPFLIPGVTEECRVYVVSYNAPIYSFQDPDFSIADREFRSQARTRSAALVRKRFLRHLKAIIDTIQSTNLRLALTCLLQQVEISFQQSNDFGVRGITATTGLSSDTVFFGHTYRNILRDAITQNNMVYSVFQRPLQATPLSFRMRTMFPKVNPNPLTQVFNLPARSFHG